MNWGHHNQRFMAVLSQTSVRVSTHKLREVLNALDDVYFALETDPEILKEAGRIKSDNPCEDAKEAVYKVINLIETMPDHGLEKMDDLLFDLHDAVDRVKGVKFEVVPSIDGRTYSY